MGHCGGALAAQAAQTGHGAAHEVNRLQKEVHVVFCMRVLRDMHITVFWH